MRWLLSMLMLGCSISLHAHEEDMDVDFGGEPDVAGTWSEAPGLQPFPFKSRGTPAFPAKGQPQGALADVIVYMSGGHGWTFWTDNTWKTQRPLLYGMVEDMGNLDQLNAFANYCFNAGATVVPFRPLGFQDNEVVIDNDDTEVTWSGTWNNSSASIFYGDPGDVPYRFAYVNTNTPTATATYTPNIPETGYYPVYCWTRRGSDRVKQLYRITHSGGVSEVRVNHERVGSGWIWLGIYYFEQGTSGSVQVSNYAPGNYNPANDVVIADTIRFGNGMGDIDRGFGVSGYERELECSRYWVQNATGQGMSTTLYDRPTLNDKDDNVGAPSRMADYMDDETNGSYWDRIYIGFHSNAGSGSGKGAMGLYNTNNSTDKQNQQKAFGLAVNSEIENDLEVSDQGVVFADDWSDNSTDLLGGVYGEISDSSNPNMNTTIIEVGFHDNAADANVLKDPAARNIIAQACYQGLVYHLSTNNANVDFNLLPDPPTHVRAMNTGSGQVTIYWKPAVTNAVNEAVATGFVVYRSANGYGFGSDVVVSSSTATSLVVNGLSAGDTWYFQVAGTNLGGESLPSETVGVRVTAAASSPALIVNGYDRYQRSLVPTRYFANNLGGNVSLIRPLQINGFDYVVQHGEALDAADCSFDSTANEAVLDGDVSLGDYDGLFWISGTESTFDDTFTHAEQTRVQSFLSGGGAMMLSGAEIAWDLDNLGDATDQAFHANYLKADYAADDAGTYDAVGATSSIFDGVGALTFDDGSERTNQTYNVKFPDVLSVNGSDVALRYGPTPGSGSVAAIQYDGTYKLVYMGFPFETIVEQSVRTNIMARVLNFFGFKAMPVIIITEIMNNPDVVTDANGEWFEVYNPGETAVDMNGWILKDAGSNNHTINNGGALLVPAGGFLVLGRNSDTNTNGGVTTDYQYANFTLNNGSDAIIILNGTTQVARVDYDGGTAWPDPTGATMELVDLNLDQNTGTNWTTATTAWPGSGGDLGSPGAAPPWDPLIGVTWTNSQFEITFKAADVPLKVWWTEDVYSWPATNWATSAGTVWVDPNAPVDLRYFRFSRP